MEFKLASREGELRTFVLVFDTGDEMLEALQRFVAEQKVGGASFTAIGAFQGATLGYFDVNAKDYLKIPIEEQVEVLSLVGNVAIEAAKGKAKIHAHVVVGKRDGSAHGGHVLEAHVRPTLEVVLTETPLHLCRRSDPGTGLALIDLRGGVP